MRAFTRQVAVTLAALLVIAVVDLALRLVPMPGHGHVDPPLRLASTLFAQTPSGWNNFVSLHAFRFSADCTDSTTNGTGLQAPCGITTTQSPTAVFPASPTAQVYYLDCDLAYAQATAAVVDSYGVQFSASPTSSQFTGFAATNVTAFATIAAPTITSTAATAVVTFTPSAITTVWPAHLSGVIELPSGGVDTTMTLLVSQATQGDAMTTKRGSLCRWWAVQ